MPELMRLYVINLDDRIDRLDHMKKNLIENGIDFIRTPAINGGHSSILKKFEEIKNSTMNMNSMALACHMSHRKTWEKFLETGDNYCMILEDDVIISRDIKYFLNQEWIPADADIIKIEPIHWRVYMDAKQEIIVSGRKIRRLRSSSIYAGGYIISKAAAKYLLSIEDFYNYTVDDMIFNFNVKYSRELVIYASTPAPVIQGISHNLIDADWAKSSILPNPQDLDDFKYHEKIIGKFYRRVLRLKTVILAIRARLKGMRYDVIVFKP